MAPGHSTRDTPDEPPTRHWHRREWLQAATAVIGAAALPLRAATEPPPEVVAALRAGGVVAAFRHALAPGSFDPPGFRLDACSTQRNLSDEGREQARRLGVWFERHRLVPSAVKSSPWCRCMDTARLAFGHATAWTPLSSPRAGSDDANAAHIEELRRALAAIPTGRFEVWVTHQFTLNALVGERTSSGEGLLLRGTRADRAPAVLGRLDLV